eukprot:2901295-Amphidinium_carterae.1
MVKRTLRNARFPHTFPVIFIRGREGADRAVGNPRHQGHSERGQDGIEVFICEHCAAGEVLAVVNPKLTTKHAAPRRGVLGLRTASSGCELPSSGGVLGLRTASSGCELLLGVANCFLGLRTAFGTTGVVYMEVTEVHRPLELYDLLPNPSLIE